MPSEVQTPWMYTNSLKPLWLSDWRRVEGVSVDILLQGVEGGEGSAGSEALVAVCLRVRMNIYPAPHHTALMFGHRLVTAAKPI